MIEIVFHVIHILMGGICIVLCVLIVIGWYAFLYTIRYRQMEDR